MKSYTYKVEIKTQHPPAHPLLHPHLPGKDGVLHVEVGLFGVGDEELWAIGVKAIVGHRDDATSVVLYT